MQEHFCVLFVWKGHCPLFRRKKHRGIPPATRPRENNIPSTLCSKIVDYPAGFTWRQKQSRRQGKTLKKSNEAAVLPRFVHKRRQKDIFFSALLKNAAQRALACSRLICRTPLPSGAAVNLGMRHGAHCTKQNKRRVKFFYQKVENNTEFICALFLPLKEFLYSLFQYQKNLLRKNSDLPCRDGSSIFPTQQRGQLNPVT